MLFLRKSFLNLINVRQNVIIKNILGLKFFSKTKALLNELGIELISQVYAKHKIFWFKTNL